MVRGVIYQSTFVCHFSLTVCPLSCKCFDPWDVIWLLFPLESWLQGSFLTNNKLDWMMAALLVLIAVKCCSDLTLLHIDNLHLFFCSLLLFLLWHLVVRQMDWVLFHLKFILNLTVVLIFALSFLEGLCTPY